MSTSGIYNYRPKVDNPNQVFHQMESGGFQTPFYFGGSQVPVNLHMAHGSGIKTSYKCHRQQASDLQSKGHGFGCGLKTTSNKNDNIKLTKYMFRK